MKIQKHNIFFKFLRAIGACGDNFSDDNPEKDPWIRIWHPVWLVALPIVILVNFIIYGRDFSEIKTGLIEIINNKKGL